MLPMFRGDDGGIWAKAAPQVSRRAMAATAQPFLFDFIDPPEGYLCDSASVCSQPIGVVQHPDKVVHGLEVHSREDHHLVSRWVIDGSVPGPFGRRGALRFQLSPCRRAAGSVRVGQYPDVVKPDV